MKFSPTDYEGGRQHETFLMSFFKKISDIIFDMKVLEKIILFVKEF